MRPGPSRGKTGEHCDPDDPADALRGSYWDHVILDPETKLIVSLVVGRRDADSVVRLFTDFYDRADGCLPQLIVTDEYAPCEAVILDAYGASRFELTVTPEQGREYDRGGMAGYFFPVEITCATAQKEKENNRAVAVNSRAVQGSLEQAEQALQGSGQSGAINTSFAERYHGAQRQFNARKKRKAYTFSKGLSCHEACTWPAVAWYNFGWCVRALRQKVQRKPPRYRYRTPAMAAGLADHAWSMRELLAYPLYPPQNPPQRPARTYADVLEGLSQWSTEPASG
jgi:hypothetical protein